MQNSLLKNLSTFLFFSFLSVTGLFAKPSPELARADSLFQQKKYIQSFELYQTVFEQHQYTPSMLLKMAYIQEGLNQVAPSIYYLNLYYLATQDDAAISKMDEVASRYHLEGYTVNEFDTLFSIYQKHQGYITGSLLALLLFFFSLLLVQRLRFKRTPFAAWTFLFLFSLLLIAHIHFGAGRSTAIISKNNTYLMDGPSAGASVVSIVRDGHRVKIKSKRDVWVKVQWGDTDVYVKNSNLLPITL